jgi:YhcN/YlaJ family sporulation lipoprotein
LSSDNKNELVALVGLTLNQGSASQAQSIKNTVTKKVKSVDRRVTQVLVTTDSNLVRRIGDIAAGIIEGKPIKSYARDVKELNRMLQK